jgi:hypothetical protein
VQYNKEGRKMTVAGILSGSKCWPTARQLANTLNIVGYKHPTKRMLVRKDILIRWGFSGEPKIQPLVGYIGNTESIRLAADKLRALEVMKDSGVRVPEFGGRATLPNAPVYIRTKHHFAGRGLQFVENPQNSGSIHLPGWNHWVKAITEPRTEYRVHVASGYLIHRQRKLWQGENPEPGSVEDRVRNHGNGWRFCSKATVKNDISIQAKAAVKALGVEWGAVDILYLHDRGIAYVLEVNTAPALSEESGSLRPYVGYLDSRISELSNADDEEHMYYNQGSWAEEGEEMVE